MPVETKVDPFKPAQPDIPGVPAGGSASSGQEKLAADKSSTIPASGQERASQMPVVWIALVLAVASIAATGLLYLGRRVPANSTQPVAPATVTNPDRILPKIKPAEDLPVAPGPIAMTSELPKDWSAKRFLFRDPVTTQLTHATVVRLPGGAYWGFSMREPFGSCELELVTDLQRLQAEYQFEARHPMVGNPCTRTVYDLMRYDGSAPDNGLVRGEIVQGSGLRPPMAIEIRIHDNQIFAGRTE